MNRKHMTYAVTALTVALVTACLLFTPSSSAQYGAWSTWSINGNVNINSQRHFLGTVSDAPVIFKTSNQECMRLTGDGDTEISGNLELGGTAEFRSHLGVDGDTDLRGRLDVTGDAVFRGGIDVDGDFSLGGNLVIRDGNIGIGTDDPLARLHVKSEGNFRGQHIAYFESTDNEEADGIAIQLSHPQEDKKKNGTRFETNSENNFITFYNEREEVTGRIEGYDIANFDFVDPPLDLEEIRNDPALQLDYGFDEAIFESKDFFSGFDPGSLPSIGSDGVFNPGSLPSHSSESGDVIKKTAMDVLKVSTELSELQNQIIVDLTCWSLENGVDNFLTPDPFSLAMAVIKLEAAIICNQGGVVYGSFGADYAEWLPKVDPEEHLQFGDIVGVFGGKVSRKTIGADRVMAVSVTPVVLGNMPPEGESYKYEKIGFMGQLPIVVRGKVKTGDYIIASGYEDGTGIAIKPDELTAGQLPFVVGRAWADSKNDLISLIQVVISPPSTESFHVIQNQENELNELRAEMNRLAEAVAQLQGVSVE